MKFSRSVLVAAGAAAFAMSAGSASAETTLKAITSLPTTLELAQSFLHNFRDAVNAANKGVVNIEYLGGPEVVPPRKAGDALRRGQFDMLHSPTAYYIGLVPEGYALTLATKTPVELRANGGWEILQKIWKEKANAKLLAWGESGTQYNTYLGQEPKFKANGNVSLAGFKMRVTGTYRPLFTALGATGVGIKATEVYTALQRGVVQGFGWPDVGVVKLGLTKLVKYRISPPFYRSNNTVTVNLDVWNKLPSNVQKALEAAAPTYEKKAIDYMEGYRKKDEDALIAAGMKTIDLKDGPKKNYIDSANISVWNRLKKQSKYADVLHEKCFPDWTPPKS